MDNAILKTGDKKSQESGPFKRVGKNYGLSV
jgi:hypothetical protein